MGIEPTSEAWEVLNFPIPFSSQGDARPLVSVNRWASKAHPVRPNSNCRLSTVSAHMVNDAAQTDCVGTPTIYLRRPRRPTSDRVAKTSPAGLQSFGFISDDLSEYMTGDLSGYNQFVRVTRRTKRQREKANSPVVQLENPLERLRGIGTIKWTNVGGNAL
jgi:hypothetical protein